MSANSLNIFFNFIDIIFFNLNYKKINDCGLTFFRTTLSLAVIKVSPEAAGGLPESSPATAGNETFRNISPKFTATF